MASLPQIRRLLVEDFPGQKAWIAPLLLIFNTFTESVVNAFNSNLNVADNMSGDILTMKFSGTLPVSVSWSKKTPPVAVIVGNAYRTDGTAITLSNAVGIVWQMSSDGKSVQVTSLTGITPSTSTPYALTLVCFAG